MKVSREFMVKMRALARAYCGGYQHALEVQTWDGLIDVANMTEQEEDEATVQCFDLVEGVELPDDAEQIDISVFGCEHTGMDRNADSTKLGYFYITLKNGQITDDWQ